MGKGMLIGADGDLLIHQGGVVVGESEMQEVSVILQLVQGEQKFFPILGANISQLLASKVSRFDLESRIKTHLELDGKSFERVKEQINTVLK